MTVKGFDANEELSDPIIGAYHAREYDSGGTPMVRIYIDNPITTGAHDAAIILSERQLQALDWKCQELLQGMVKRRVRLEALHKEQFGESYGDMSGN